MPNNIMSRETAKKRKRDGRAGRGGGRGWRGCGENDGRDESADGERLDAWKAASPGELEEVQSSSSLGSWSAILEARCESLERSVQILTKDAKWKYSAPAIPTSHWIDRGFDEHYIEGMEDF